MNTTPSCPSHINTSTKAMAYAEICTCIRTLQEATFQQESEIFRLREREAQLKLLVKDLCEKLHGATGPRDSLRNGSVTGLEQSRDILNNESNSLNCRQECIVCAHTCMVTFTPYVPRYIRYISPSFESAKGI